MSNALIRLTSLRQATSKAIPTVNLLPKNGSFQLQFRKLTEQAIEDTKKKNPINQIQRTLSLCRNVERNSFGMNFYQKKLTTELAKEQPQIKIEELKEIIYLQKTDSEIDFVAKAVLSFLSTNKIPYGDVKNDISPRFVQVLYLLKKTNKLIQFYNEKDSFRLFRSHRSMETFYKCLYEEKRYDELIDVFLRHIGKYRRINKNIEQSKDAEENVERTMNIPMTHLDLFTKALLHQSNDDSLSRFKYAINYMEKNNAVVPVFVWIRIYYLALLKGESQFSLNLVNYHLFESSRLLSYNLKVISLIRNEKLDRSFKLMQSMINNNVPFLPIIFQSLREASNKTENKERAEEIDFLYKKILMDSVLNDKDLVDYAFDDDLLHFESNESQPESASNDLNEEKIVDSRRNKLSRENRTLYDRERKKNKSYDKSDTNEPLKDVAE